MHLAIWGQSCFLHCSHTNSLFTIRDGECGGWPPLTSPQLLSAYWGGCSWWFPNNWLCSVVSDSVQPHRRQPSRLHHPWDSPVKNTGVGCHFLLHCMQVKSESEVSQSCPTPSDPMDCSPPGSSVHGIFQALEWGAIAFSLEKAQSHSVQFIRSIVSDSLRPHESQHTRPPCPSPTHVVLKLMSIKLVMPSSHLILCHPLLLLPPNPPSIRVFSNESTLCMRWPKYWSFSFSISPSNEHPGLISFRMDWLDLLAVQGTLKSLPQHHSSKASIFRLSASFTVQLSCPYMTTGKTIASTRRTFVGKVMSLLRAWQITPVLLSGESHRQRSLALPGYSP